MSWYLFKDSPQRQYRGKKVDGYSNMHNNKVILDWGLGQLSPKKDIIFKAQQPPKNAKSLYQKDSQKNNKSQKIRTIQQTIKILTQSSDEQDKQQLIRVLKNYNKKRDKETNDYRNDSQNFKIIEQQHNKNNFSSNSYNNSNNNSRSGNNINRSDNNNNRSDNVLNSFGFNSSDKNIFVYKKQRPNIDNQTAKRMRFLQNSLLPSSKQDNVTPILDFDLSQKMNNSLGDSRLSGKSHFGNKKNQSLVQFGNGYNQFVPIKQKVKDMNQRLKQMYQYDQLCKKRQTSQIKLG